MKILVCIKTPTGGAVDAVDAFQRAGRSLAGVLSPFDARAVEEALRIRERLGGETVVVTVGPAETLGAMREALAMGIDRGLLLADPALADADLLAVSRAAAALLAVEAPDLCLYSSWSGDIDGILFWGAVAERLQRPMLSQVSKLKVEADRVTGERQTEQGDLVMSASLPCMVEVTADINKPRYATLKGKQNARVKSIQVLRASEFGGEELGCTRNNISGTKLLSLNLAPRNRRPVLVDREAAAAEEILSFLKRERFIV